MTFKERFFLGEIPFEDIDRYTSRWNFSDETCTLAAYLGLNGEEEDVWISQSDEALEALLEKEKAAYLACPTKILFTDLDGNVTHYAVAEIQVLGPGQVEDMTSGDYPLTLFTCTYGGKSRITVRCDAVG